MKIAIVYFSATGNTEIIANVVKEKLIETQTTIEEINIANYSVRNSLKDFEKYDALIFGFPIHYWRAPRLIREWLRILDGKGIKCSVFFTYGGLHVGAAHYDIRNILDGQNFDLVASAEFLGKHTYNLAGWNLMETRPNDDDLKIAREFALISYKRFKEDDTGRTQFEKPKQSSEEIDTMELTAKRAIPSPFREVNECSRCGTCEEVCPVNAMDKEKGKPNREICIRCLRCVVNCPDEVLKMKDMSAQFQLMQQQCKLNEEKLRTKKSKILL